MVAQVARLACLLLLAAWSAPARAQPLSEAARALLAVEDGDPLELARVVRRAGDAAVLRLLEPEQPVRVRLCAARAAPWLKAPEQALLLLAGWLVGRDAVLAEAAARACARIAQGFDADVMTRRELTPAEFSAAVGALQAAAERSWLRADLRLLAAQAVAQLVGAGVPPPH